MRLPRDGQRSLGVMFRREWAPERLVDVARRVEDAGFDELWVVEDLGYHGGFTQAATALASTTDLRVGLGIAPAVARNAAYAAMEIATLGRLFPGRFLMGIGHGVEGWIAQVGATPASWLASIEEVSLAITALLDGETVGLDGRHVHLRDVRLVHPPPERPTIQLGVIGPRSVEVAGRSADGIILCEGTGPRFVADVRARLGDDARITVLVFAAVDTDGRRNALTEMFGGGPRDARLTTYAGEVATLDEPTPSAIADLLLDEVSIGGDPDGWSSATARWFDAGADSVILTPLPTDPTDVIDGWVVEQEGAP